MQVLTETDHCFCVLLNANDGAAFPSDDASHGAAPSIDMEPQDCSSSNNSSLRVDTDPAKSNKVWVDFSLHTRVIHIIIWSLNPRVSTATLMLFLPMTYLIASCYYLFFDLHLSVMLMSP